MFVVRSAIAFFLSVCMGSLPAYGHTVDDFVRLKAHGETAPFGNDESETYTEVWGANGLAFLGSESSGVAIMDLNDAESLATVSVFGADLGIGFYDVRTSGDFGFFSTREIGTLVVDLSEPTTPIQIASIDSETQGFDAVTNATIYGDYLFQVSSFSPEITVADISNPTSPAFVTRIATNDSVGIYDLTIADDRLYAAGLGGTDGEGAAYIYDISKLSELETSLVGQVPTGKNTASVWPNSHHSKLIATNREVGGGVSAWDITDPSKPKLIDSTDASDFGINAYSAGQTFVLDQTAYTTWHQAGMQVLDLDLLDESDTIFRTGALGTSQASPLEKFVGNTSVFPVSHSQVLLADSRWGLYTVDASELVLTPSVNLETICARVADGELLPADLANALDELGILAGDADQNGTVEFADFLGLSRNFGEREVGFAGGDFDCDGVVQFTDFLILSRNFGQSHTAAAVPEPNGLVLCLIGFVGLRVFHQRR